MKEKLLYFLKRSKGLIYILGFVLSLVGSYQVFHGQFDNIIKEIEVILYSVIKLFLFFPMKSVTDDIPLAYNLAIWIAPIGTVIGFISLFDNVYNQLYDVFIHKGRKHTILMGYNENTITYLQNIHKKQKYVVLVDEALDDNKEKELKKLGAIVAKVNYDNPDHISNVQLFKEYKLNDTPFIISFEKEPKSYSLLESLSKMFKTNRVIEVYFMNESASMKDLMTNHLDYLTQFDIHYFNLEDLLAQELIFNKNFFFHQTPIFNQHWGNFDFSSFDRISEQISNPSILLIGFESLGQRLLLQASNQATINPKNTTKVTIIDSNFEKNFNQFDGSIQHLEEVLTIKGFSIDIHSRLMSELVAKVLAQDPATTIVYTLNDASESLLNIQRLSRYLKNSKIGVYCPNTIDIQPLLSAITQLDLNVTLFGEKQKVLNDDVIINETYFQKAKAFNGYYNEVATELMGWDKIDESLDEQWKKLSTLKKESSLYQTNHQVVKRDLLKKICEHPDYPDTLDKLLDYFRNRLTNKSVSQQVDEIESDPLMNFLCALEHKRWDNFYFMRDFTYGIKTNEIEKVHNCLIDDWSDFMKSEVRDKAIYDFLSVLSVKDE